MNMYEIVVLQSPINAFTENHWEPGEAWLLLPTKQQHDGLNSWWEVEEGGGELS